MLHADCLVGYAWPRVIGVTVEIVERNYSAADVKAREWRPNSLVDGTTSAQHLAEKACAQIDASRLRVQSTRQRNKKCGNLVSGAWCLPEGDDAKKTVSLPHGQSYMLPVVHVLADAPIVIFLDRLLRGCDDPAGRGAMNLTAFAAMAPCVSIPRYSILDIGAGVGQYGHALLALDPAHRYSGVDGAGNVERLTNGFLRWANLASPELSLPRADWVMSLEVGEHVPHAVEQHFVRNLHAHNCVGIVLSWSHPPYGGCGHVNNHHTPYIVALFAELGYVHDADASRLLRERHTRTKANTIAWRPKNTPQHAGLGGPFYWFRESIYVLRRAKGLMGPGCTRWHGGKASYLQNHNPTSQPGFQV